MRVQTGESEVLRMGREEGEASDGSEARVGVGWGGCAEKRA